MLRASVLDSATAAAPKIRPAEPPRKLHVMLQRGERSALVTGPRASIRVGISGWSYPGWRGRFYPEGLSPKRELAFAAERFESLEVNRSFYSLLRPSTCLAWYDATPASTVFACKGSQFITHSKKLRDVEGALANFFASGVLALEEKLGPIVWQLPKQLAFDEARIASFLALLPRTTSEAALLARRHDQRVKHGAHLEVRRSRPLRHAIEPRHESFCAPRFAALMRRFGAAIAVSESPDWPCIEELTTSFVYIRLHGAEHTYVSQYTDAQLARWAERIRAWHAGSEPADARRISRTHPPRRKGRDVYVYFDNDVEAHAPQDALRLKTRLRARK